MKKVIAILMICAIVINCVACSGGNENKVSDTGSSESNELGESSTPGNSALQAGSDETYYMLAFYSGIEYWQGCYAGFEKAAALYGANTVFDGPTDLDIAAYIDYIEAVIAKKPAGIALTCSDAVALNDVISKAIEAGIPVVTYDSDAPTSERLCYLGTGNYAAGETAAKFLAEEIDESGNVAVVGAIGAGDAQNDRMDGFTDYMEKNYPDINIVTIENGDGDAETAASVTAAVLQKYDNIDGIYTTSAQMGTGTATAVKEAGMAGKVKIVAYDTDTATLDAIMDGTITGTVVQGTELMGFWAFQMLFQVNNDLVVDDWKKLGLNPIPTTVDTGVSVITAATAENYY